MVLGVHYIKDLEEKRDNGVRFRLLFRLFSGSGALSQFFFVEPRVNTRDGMVYRSSKILISGVFLDWRI